MYYKKSGLLMKNISKLIEVIEQSPKSQKIPQFISLAENEFSADITKQLDLLKGV